LIPSGLGFRFVAATGPADTARSDCAVARIENVFGDRNLVCTCVGMEAYKE